MKRRSTKAKTPSENALLIREIKHMRMGKHPLTRSEACRRIELNYGIYISHTKARSIEFSLQSESYKSPTVKVTTPRLRFFGMLNQPTAVSGE